MLNKVVDNLIFLFIAAVLAFAFLAGVSWADKAKAGGEWKNNPMHAWFDTLSSKRGLCCSFADGRTVEDPDWGTQNKTLPNPMDVPGDGHSSYWVTVDGKKIDVPDAALVAEPNKYGMTVVWPYRDYNGQMQIRCFMPGVMT